MLKTCYRCCRELPLSDFYKHNGMADGYLNKCKECCKKESKTNRNNNIEYYRKYDTEELNYHIGLRRLKNIDAPRLESEQYTSLLKTIELKTPKEELCMLFVKET